MGSLIKKNGLIQKILVRPVGNDYEIVHGERRYRALKLLRRNNLDVEVKEMTKEQAQKIALAENIQREDLSPIDLATELKKQLQTKTQEQLSKEINKSQTFISQNLSFLELPKLAQIYLSIGLITKEHAKELLGFQKLLNKLGYDKIIEYEFEGRKISKTEDFIVRTSDIVVDYILDAKRLAKGIDIVVFEEVRKMNKEDMTYEQMDMIRWMFQKSSEWCQHEWAEDDDGGYCERCGRAKPKELEYGN